MKFVFIDEYHSSPKGNPYTAAIASIWKEEILAPFRSEFVRTIGNAINTEPHRINPFPIIHASDRLQGTMTR
jgi:hypothetical protein